MTYKPGTFFTVAYKSVDARRYRKLSCNAKAAYFEFQRIYYGHNNGNLLMSSRMMAKRLGVGKTLGAECILELTTARFIEVTCRDEYGQKPKARTYRLMEYKCDVSGIRAWQASSVSPKRNPE